MEAKRITATPEQREQLRKQMEEDPEAFANERSRKMAEALIEHGVVIIQKPAPN